MHDKTNFRSYLHRISSWMDPAATLLANPVNPMLCTTKIGLITQSSQLYNIPLDGKTNFGSVQHRISSWISHLSGRQACPFYDKTNFRSIQHRISSWMDHSSCIQGCPLHGKTNFRSIQNRIHPGWII